MNVQHIAAFSRGEAGGNPAGVALLAQMPPDAEMQRVATEVGYSETAFVVPRESGYRVRYFAPDGEVPFCGHATIALGAVLAGVHGRGDYSLTLNEAQIHVSAEQTQEGWQITLLSPPTSFRPVEAPLAKRVLDLFGWDHSDLDPSVPIVRINAGAEHLLIALRDHALLQNMSYEFSAGAALMREFGLVTIDLIWRETDVLFHSRNPFAGHGVYEDPATGAAAAALGGYLRDAGLAYGAFDVIQGADMGMPSHIHVAPLPGTGQPVRISGLTRAISA
ncbi:PhzF family phenazine biosynthesis protein [Actibacterium sp. XHP0104]|uniref:PhzF family phenazine biosynthesis protein n=1 Tax=Actibacterium sp. XHP0104 TaxID=2984335 RepID=UPI0021E8FFFE|nr:PhzF family phenazine biosynthesis protein [Actibacterium sp. XHP0104]MCV2882166.1 PhzF family phenazine biosynthesis protein [Actibacterium sp. XHP0104]